MNDSINFINSHKNKVLKSANGYCLTCLTFLDNNHLIAGDSDGLIVWLSVTSEMNEIDTSVNELKAHNVSIIFSNELTSG